MRTRNLTIAAGIATGIAATLLRRYRTPMGFRSKVAFVTGGSRGLGLLLARELASRGAHVAISARDPEELTRAEEQIRSHGGRVLTIAADMTMRDEVEAAIRKVEDEFGEVEILVNNAGTIAVGPIETMTIDDYRNSINTHFWGPYFTTMAVLPQMQRRRSGRIVNISSIGGKISVPHLLPYSVGKFALTGFSEGLRSELLKDGVYVTTVCPGLTRTGSPRNAFFKGNNEAEYAWFSVSDALPILSMSANRAAHRIIDACARGDGEVVLTVPAQLATLMHGIFPDFTIDMLGIMNRFLPGPGGIGTDVRTGKESKSKASPSWITALNERAAAENNQIV
ncbi:MAG TPA: SDR family NAD(P)-dependent oxidoreductase [Candidatus Sulfotelmatobacter sp.]|nr:SDR family NAD(P)-dependent oxidoreductase [Candidatus Sulfotelmatobacter sp.]